ncbi:MAG: DMT family transporter [Acidobacteriota bacterium]
MSRAGARGRAALALAILAVSTAAPLVRLAPDADPLRLAFWRLALAGALVAVVLRPRGLLSPRAWRWGGVAGVLLAVHFGAWFWSLRLTSVASSVTLVTTAPLFAAVIAPRWLGDRTSPRLWVGALAALAGVALIAHADGRAGGGSDPLLGDALALLAAGAGSVYLLIGRRVRAEVEVEAQVAMTCLAGAAALAVAVVASGQGLAPASMRVGLVALALALGPHLTGHGLLNVAVRHRPAQEVQLALLGEPVLSSILAALLFAEWPHASFYPGGALVLGGLAIGLSGAPAPAATEPHA